MPDLSLSQIAGVAEQPGAFEMQQADSMANQDTFLKLLTTQLSNQDPTSPMENEQFLSQLAQFSSLESLMGLQQSMDAVYTGIQAMNNASMAALLGTEVTVHTDTMAHTEGEELDIGWRNGGGVTEGKITITDESGRVVHTADLGALDDEGSYTWDGTDADGNALPDGNYTVKINGSDAEGNPVNVTTTWTGTVDGMDYSSGVPQPYVNGVPVGLGDIVTLRAGESA